MKKIKHFFKTGFYSANIVLITDIFSYTQAVFLAGFCIMIIALYNPKLLETLLQETLEFQQIMFMHLCCYLQA